MTKTEDTRLWCNHKEADTKMMLFHVGHLVAPNSVVVRTADTDVLIIALANMEKLPVGINIWLQMGLHMNNTLRYVNVNKLYQALGSSLYVALPGFHAFTGSDYTASFNRKGKIRPLKLLKRREDAKKAFSVLKGPLLSEGEVQTTFKAIEKSTCAMYGRKNFTSNDEAWLDIFLQKYKPNKNGNVLNRTLGKLTAAAYPHTFVSYKRRFCDQHLLVTCGIISSIQIL